MRTFLFALRAAKISEMADENELMKRRRSENLSISIEENNQYGSAAEIWQT